MAQRLVRKICDRCKESYLLSLREIIDKDEGKQPILKATLEGGMRPMSEDGIDKVSQGITNVEELFRVVPMREEEAEFSCPSCGELVRKEFPNCLSCGYGLAERCPGRGEGRVPCWQFCPRCEEGKFFGGHIFLIMDSLISPFFCMGGHFYLLLAPVYSSV